MLILLLARVTSSFGLAVLSLEYLLLDSLKVHFVSNVVTLRNRRLSTIN